MKNKQTKKHPRSTCFNWYNPHWPERTKCSPQLIKITLIAIFQKKIYCQCQRNEEGEWWSVGYFLMKSFFTGNFNLYSTIQVEKASSSPMVLVPKKRIGRQSAQRRTRTYILTEEAHKGSAKKCISFFTKQWRTIRHSTATQRGKETTNIKWPHGLEDFFVIPNCDNI